MVWEMVLPKGSRHKSMIRTDRGKYYMKLLFIAGHEFMEEQDNGGRQCSYRNYTVLQQIFGEKNVYLCMLSNVTQTDERKNIQVFPTHRNKVELVWNTMFFRNGYSWKSKKEMIQYINRVNADIVWFDFSITGLLVHHIRGNPRIVVFQHNIEKKYMWNRMAKSGLSYLLPYLSYSYNERCVLKKANDVICLNKRDGMELRECYARTPDFYMPMTFRDRYDEKKAQEAKTNQQNKKQLRLLFVGSMFPPNYDGILWFVRNVMTRISGCILYIVGKNMETKSEELVADNVEVVGTVDDLSNYYYEADVVVLPILYGNGMKVKTAEAMMYGKPILATREALEGYDISGIEGIRECDSIEQFVSVIEELKCVKMDGAIESHTRELFLNKYETSHIVKCLEDFLRGNWG